MTPEQKAREVIDKKLAQSGWVVQDRKQLNLLAGLGVAVREFPTSTGPVDYALFVEGIPVGIVEAKKDTAGENITVVEDQSSRYAHSTLKWVSVEYQIRFAYEATGKLTRFTDYADQKYRSRTVFAFHRPEELRRLLRQQDTVRNRMKYFPALTQRASETVRLLPSRIWKHPLPPTAPKRSFRWQPARERPSQPLPLFIVF